MKPRKKAFGKRDNRLRLAYQEMGINSNRDEIPEELRGKPYGDIIGCVPADEKGNWDIKLLFHIFFTRPIRDHSWDSGKKDFIEYPTLIKELENRGYDPRTIYFEIEKRDTQKEYICIADNFEWVHLERINDSKLRDKKLKALEIIVRKEVDIFSIRYTASFERYNYRMSKTGFVYAHRLLTQEEYDLLKEIFDE